MKKIDLKGIGTDEYNKLSEKLKDFMVTVGSNTESENLFVESVQLVRADCKSKQQTQDEMSEYMKDDYEVVFIEGDSTAAFH
jgi:hypothetical protein